MARNTTRRAMLNPRDLLTAARLWADPRVPVYLKLIPLLVLAYVLSPVDLVPEVLVGLGLVDDLAVLVMGLKIFTDLAASARENDRRVQHDAPSTATVEGSYRIVD